MRVWEGGPHPLGASWDGHGTNFALYSRHADAVELCLFDHKQDRAPAETIPLQRGPQRIWHVYLPDVRPPQLYGFRVGGPSAPDRGHRFDATRTLVDPYALAIAAPEPQGSGRTNVGRPDVVLKSVVTDPSFPWGDDASPQTPWSDTIVYECHVKGTSIAHPLVPESLRGTYGGLASGPVISHLQSLGVTAVQLMPVHHALTEERLAELGLTNYWGYNTLGFFAPDPRFASGDLGQQVSEFKAMVRALHRAGLEVLIDVVYNHTCEGGSDGPTFSFRGIDNASYYHLDREDPARYVDYTGCGNTLDFGDPAALRLLMDSLRYWVREMHVDGFRFDLAPALARDSSGDLRLDRLMSVIQQDPYLAQVKLIAEPWDVGTEGYRLGGFPPGWAEWNDRARDGIRRFWRGDEGQAGEFSRRLAGSADLFDVRDRGPLASVHYVASHDGFPLVDLFRYEQKHNEANGEDNRDGHDANWSTNCGVEGPDAAPEIVRRRLRLTKSAIASVAISQGVPMLAHGDELGRTQGGNNNAYCQDDETTWIDWSLDPWQEELLDFCRKAFELRASYPQLRRSVHFTGERQDSTGTKDVAWYLPDGKELDEAAWERPDLRAFGMLIGPADDVAGGGDGSGRERHTLLALFNAGSGPVAFRLPIFAATGEWALLLSSQRSRLAAHPRESVRLSTSSVAVLRWRPT